MVQINENMTAEDRELDHSFAALRRAEPGVSDALTARLLADADRLMPQKVSLQDRLHEWIARLSEPFGGWRGGMALTASAVFGLWIGYSVPDALNTSYTEFTISTDLPDAEETLFDTLLSENEA